MNRQIPVMLVEVPEVCNQTKLAFADSNFELCCHTDPEQARMSLNASRYEVAVVDLRARTADDRLLIEHVIDSIPKIRCIALVERPDIASVQQAMKLGCKSYLAKPTNGPSIFEAVKEVAQSFGLLSLTERELQLRLSRLIRAQRLRQDLTLTEMAQRIGLSKAQLSQIELGKSWPSFPTLKRISDELDQPFSELFKLVEQG